MRTEYPENFFEERCIFWLYMTKDELLATGVSPLGISENLNEDGLTSACLTPEEAESFIPRQTLYCYTRGPEGFKCCPYWDRITTFPSQSNGHCHYNKCGDYNSTGIGLLWDQVKECGKFEDMPYDD